MADVFISYKAEDRRRIQPLVQALQADGYSVWWDEHIGTGDEWRQTIEHQLDSARCVIVIWSKRSVGPDGHFVRDEASRAQRRHVYVPVLIDAVDPPLGFGESQATSLKSWHGDRTDRHYQAVLSAIQRTAGTGSGSAAEAGQPAQKMRVSRRALIGGGAAAATAVAAVGAWTLFRSKAAEAAGSIAVLPFANLSGDPNQAYFADGVAEEIRSSLARLAGLKVVGRTSSEAVRNDDAQTAARKLEVANILTGSVRQSPSTMRISAELVDGRTGLDRWSQDYDRAPGDAIKIQTDIAENVASALSAALGQAARTVVSVGGTQNVDAQRMVIQATALGNGSEKKESLEKALQLLDSAIALDPHYADAYASKAIFLGIYGNSYANAQQLGANRAEALKLAKTALEIAPDLPRAHSALGYVYQSNLQIGPAYAQLKQARRLGPSNAEIVAAFGNTLSALGDAGGALTLADQAIALDPLNHFPYNVRLGVLFAGRRYADAVAYGRQLREKFPDDKSGEMIVADSLVLLGRYRDAQPHFETQPPEFWRRITGEAIIGARTGDRAAAEQKLAALRERYGDAASTQFGEIYAQLGDKERAFTALDRAFEIKDAGLTGMKVDAFLDPLRSDPRFTALLQRMNFPSA